MKKHLLLLSALFSANLFADAPLRLHLPAEDVPWFTGPLLTPSAYVVKGGHVNYEPYVFATAVTGSYNSEWQSSSEPLFWGIVEQHYLQIGLTPWMEVQIVPTTTFNTTEGAFSFQVSDLPIQLQIQLYSPADTEWYPAVKLTIGETFPTGKYERLNPSLLGTDSAGAGCYQTVAGLSFGHLFKISGYYFSALRFSGYYQVSSRTHVHGENTYGGAVDTDGWIYPGQACQFYLGWEISLARHWTFALDAVAGFEGKTTFKGRQGSMGSLESGSGAQYSLAPAIEWNWGRNIGLISGVWFTFAGRNSSQFISWTTALNYYY